MKITAIPSSKVQISSMRQKNRPSIVLCARDTYSKIGGLQNFNRRVVDNLSERLEGRDEARALALILGDYRAAFPRRRKVDFIGFRSRVALIFRTLWLSATQAEMLVLCHVNFIPLAAFARLLRPRLPILLFVHGDEVWDKRSSCVRQWCDTRFLRAVTRIASVSAFTAEKMSAAFDVPRDKFRLLPNAVDPLKPAANPAQREPATILIVNRMDARDRKKNIDQVIRAVAELKGRVPGLKLELIGDGGLRPELEALAASLGLADVAKFHGWVCEDELQGFYERARVFAMPSSKEGFGIVYLEAWLRRLPVICSSEGASSEVVADGVDGFVVDPGDISMLADRLHTLLTNPTLATSMGERGKRKVEQNYLNPVFRSNLDAIIDELLTGAPRRPLNSVFPPVESSAALLQSER